MPAKTLTLPNGATADIIAPNNFILLQAGNPPRSLQRNGVGSPDRDLNDVELNWLVHHQKILLTRCVSPLRFPDGRVERLVDKPWADTPAGEISLEALDQPTADLLAAEIGKLREEAAASAATFRNGSAEKPSAGPADTGSPCAPVSVPTQ